MRFEILKGDHSSILQNTRIYLIPLFFFRSHGEPPWGDPFANGSGCGGALSTVYRMREHRLPRLDAEADVLIFVPQPRITPCDAGFFNT